MHKLYRILLASTLCCSAALSQTAVRSDTNLDRLRGDYVRSLDDFLKLDPALEKELLTAPKEEMLRRIERSRRAAEAHSRAKARYYSGLMEAADEMVKVLRVATQRPSEQMLKQMEARREYLKSEEEQATQAVAKLRTQREALVREGRPAEEIERIGELIVRAEQDEAAVRTVLQGVEGTIADTKSSMNEHRGLMPALEKWRASQESMSREYKTLYANAQKQIELWSAYHDDLARTVQQRGDRRDSRKK